MRQTSRMRTSQTLREAVVSGKLDASQNAAPLRDQATSPAISRDEYAIIVTHLRRGAQAGGESLLFNRSVKRA